MEDKIKSVGIVDFQKMGDAIVYQDEDIVMINSKEAKSNPLDLIRVECLLIGVCIEGTLEVEINYCKYRLHAGDMVFILPNAVASTPSLTSNGKLRFSVISTRFLQGVLKMERKTWETILVLKEHPVMRKGDYATPPVLYHLSQVFTAELKDTQHYYHREVMRHIFSAFFCELIGRLMEMFKEDYGENLPDSASRPTLYVMTRFVKMLSQDGGIHRTVAYYADEICYTPKHFSKLIKDASGRTPLDIITERSIECIKYTLQHSHKSIKEIAEDFQFPNQSFFGKYVKKHTGMTPQELREAGEKS